MAEKYDVVVIGSGIGGMCAAARLAHAGYKTLVVEKMPILGGRLSTTEYKGFTLSTGAIGVECSGVLEQTFQEVGAEFSVRRPDPQLAYRVQGKEYQMPPKGGLRWLLHQVSADEREAERVMGAIKRGLAWHEPSMSITLKDWLTQHTKDTNIHNVIQAFCAAMLVINYYEVPAGCFFQFIKMGAYRDFGFAVGGNINLIEALARVVRKKGDIWTKSRARQILVEDSVAKGIVVDRGTDRVRVEARAVIGNAGPQETVRLAGAENFDKGYLKDLKERLRPGPVVALFVSSDRPLVDHPGALIPTGTRRVCLMFTPTMTCPELAPKGKHYMEAFGAFGDSLGPVDPKKEIDLCIQDVRENTKGFDEHGEILMAQTFTGEWPAFRTWPGYDLPQKTPIENLYNVGDAVKVPGFYSGVPACAETARVVAEDIKARLPLR